ncbi:sensor histidine kinase [Streptomyces sp. NBC_01387]|uniref:sensor histidine kinase n=1 Tax=unclassified Streptomyces TaxID=2593676 RepID=UPI002024AB51|nr:MULTISPECIES: sensor histidine kinase [unclassified Streptomyces]MCX4548063.1 sensor histidine kinase [Streptomyces sp. NBC_01500]WSC19728.1 sensor histidine kinase [Streptomyces sp. NBC_01766]WSV53750.1 sensor histidine kinase [Streptomyces sp. NBC_01014]
MTVIPADPTGSTAPAVSAHPDRARVREAAVRAAAASSLVEQRWATLQRWGPYGLLAFSTVVGSATIGALGTTTGELYVAGTLIVAAVLLQLWWGRALPSRQGPGTLGALYYFLRWAIAFVLTWINPFFAFYASTGYIGAERVLPRRLLRAGLFASAVTIAGSQSGGLPPRGSVGWVIFGVVLGINLTLLTVFGRVASREEELARAQVVTIGELERTNIRLQQALDENTALHAQLLVQAREAGVADERRRLAAEIHDTLAQGLTGIITQLQVVTMTGGTPETAREHLARAQQLARHSLGEARRSVQNLSPVALADDSLPEALEKLVGEWSRSTGVRAEFTVTGTVEPLHDEVEATLLRIAQEALTNTARHSGAARVGVTLSYMDDEMALDVRDDGRGFDPLALPPRSTGGGFGLGGMCARAERIAGTVTVESEPGHGTAVSARVPLVRDEI